MKGSSKLAIAALGILLLPIIFNILTKGSLLSFHKSFSFNSQADDSTQDSALEKIVEDDLGDKPGTYGVYIQSLTDLSDKYVLNGVASFPAASLYKIILLAAVYQEEEQGRIKPDDTLTDTKTHLSQIYGSVDYGYDDAPEQVQYSVSDAMDRVARLSDNFAAIMLTNDLKSKTELGDLAKTLGMNDTHFENNPISTTPDDIGLLFRKLYLGQVVDKNVSNKLTLELEKDEINDRIPAQLPPTSSGSAIPVSHKTGEFPGVRHDAGIVFLPNNPYVIVMMSKDVPFEDDAVSNLANLSKDVYNYFNSKSSSKS